MIDDEMDLEAMIENPFRNVRRNGEPGGTFPVEPTLSVKSQVRRNPAHAGERNPGDPKPGIAESRTERNHPLELRVLSLEKNDLLTAKKLDDIRRIIEHQNERIRLLEEELSILREALGRGEA